MNSERNSSDRREELLAQLDEQPALQADSTVKNLHAEIATIVEDLRKPRLPDPHAYEVERARAIEFAKSLAEAPDAATALDATRVTAMDDSGELGKIGPYQLLKPIGSGSMGTVYKALHVKLQKVVALKILSATSLGSSEAVTRFEREMQAVGKLDHPHIVRAMDAGDADGLHYLAMEYVPGIDLAQLLKRRGRLPVAEACECIRQAAVGLHAAHQRGMVHRDVKPGNLMLASQEFGFPVIKVLDLGLARLANADVQVADELTTAGQVMGTIDYMAPEQVDNSHAVDGRADVYSLGATLFALLTGASIFHDRPRMTLMQKLYVLSHEPAPSIAKLREDIPTELASIISRMLSLAPADRFDTAVEVADALAPFAQGADFTGLLSSDASCTVQHDAIPSQWETKFPVPSGRSTPTARRWTAIITAVAGGLLVLGGILLSLRGPYGDVLVELPDDLPPEIAAQIRVEVRGDAEVQVVDQSQGWKIRVTEGRYDVQLAGSDDRFEISRDTIEVDRNDQAIVRVTIRPIEVPTADGGGAASPVDDPDTLVSPENAFIEAEWMTATRALPVAEQVVAVGAKLAEVNTGDVATVEHDPATGEIHATIEGEYPSFWPLLALSRLDTLRADIRPDNATRVSGLSAKHLAIVRMTSLHPLAADWVRSLPQIESINGLSVDEWLLTEADIAAWREQFSEMQPVEQARQLRVLLMQRNPGYTEDLVHGEESGDITAIQFSPSEHLLDLSPLRIFSLTALQASSTQVVDLSPLHGMDRLTWLELNYTPVWDLSPLQGSPLSYLVLSDCHVSDLSPLSGMPLKKLVCHGTLVEDLSPLADTPLVSLSLVRARVSDLTPIASLRLEDFIYFQSNISDLSPLADMPLKVLQILGADWTPIKGMPLEVLECYPEHARQHTDWLATHPSLQTVNGLPVAEFLESLTNITDDSGASTPEIESE